MTKQSVNYILEATIRDVSTDGETKHVTNASFPTRESAYRFLDKIKEAFHNTALINWENATLVTSDEVSDDPYEEYDEEELLREHEEWLKEEELNNA